MAGRLIVETERLWLREFEEEDAAAYYALGSDPDVVRYTGADRLTSLEQALDVLRARPLADYQRHGFGRWACVLKTSGDVIGWAGLKYLEELGEVDLGYWLRPPHWGKGLATEAARASLHYGLEQLHLESIIGLVHPANSASIRVLEKIGMSCAGSVLLYGGTLLKYVIGADRITSSKTRGANQL